MPHGALAWEFFGLIQSVLFFVFGFLVALFLALLVAPTVWRRAVYLTRKRVEAAVPLTANELQADKDRLRAEHAIELRKANIVLERERAKNVETSAKVAALQEDKKKRIADQEAKAERIAELETIRASQDGKIETMEGTLADLRLELATTSAELAARGGEVDNLAHQLRETEARLAETTERVLTREQDLEAARATVNELRQKRTEDQGKVRESRNALRETAELLKNEKSRYAELENRHERVIASATTLEDKLARREKDIARIREKKADEDAELGELEIRLEDAARERQALETELAELTVRFNQIVKQVGDDDPAKVVEALKAENARLAADAKGYAAKMAQMQQAVRESAVVQPAPVALANGDGEAILRDELQNLAAQVVHMTAMVEGKDSRINTLIGDAPSRPGNGPFSLADRIAALRKATASKQS